MSGYNVVMINTYMKRSEREIHNLCNNSARELFNRKFEMHQQINSWRDDLVRQIDDHVRDQTKALEREYEKQMNDVESARCQFLNATRPLENYSGNNERIYQLVEQCKALRFELAALEFPERLVPFIQFMTEELIRKKQNERNTKKTTDNLPRSNVGGNRDNITTDNASAHGSGTSNQTSSTHNQGP